MDAVVLFDPVNSGETLKAYARKKGYKVIGVFPNSEAIYKTSYHRTPEALAEGCDEIIMDDHLSSILQKLKNSPFQIKACIPGNENGVELAEQAASALGLYANPMPLSEARRNKGIMRQVLKKGGLSCPDFFVCSSEEEIKQFAAKHPFPLVIKTPKGAATHHVFVCKDLQECLEGFKEIVQEKNFFGLPTHSAVLETYIGGREYVVNTFSDGKEVHFSDVWYYEKIRSATHENIYYNTISLPPTDAQAKRVIDYGLKVVSLFQISRGAAHMEIKDDPHLGPTLIEIGARLSGSSLPMLIQKYSNFDPFSATIDVFTQGTTSPNLYPIVLNKHLAAVHCPTLKGGKIKKVLGLEQIQKLPSYDSHQLYVQLGDVIAPSSDLGSIPCMVLLGNRDRAQLLKDVEATHTLFSLEF
jgi:biotin carboxylase